MITVYDIETFPNCFTYTDKDYHTKEVKQFVIHRDRNEFENLVKHLSTKDLSQVGFNNVHFDYPIIHHLLTHYDRLKIMIPEKICEILYNKAQEIINAEKYFGIPEKQNLIPQLDLFLIWHFENPSKKCSLKDIEFALQMDNIEEMPFAHDIKIKEDDIKKVLNYNLNDVLATELFFDVTLGKTDISTYKGKDKLQLRKDIKNTFGLNCLNYNDVKIGDSINKKEYLKNSGLDYSDLKNLKYQPMQFKFKDCIPEYVQFKTKELQDFKQMIGEFTVNLDGEKQIFDFLFRNTAYTIAKGGIHSCDKPRKIRAKDNEILRDADVGLNMAQLKFLKLTGTPLEFYLLNCCSNTIMAYSNVL